MHKYSSLTPHPTQQVEANLIALFLEPSIYCSLRELLGEIAVGAPGGRFSAFEAGMAGMPFDSSGERTTPVGTRQLCTAADLPLRKLRVTTKRRVNMVLVQDEMAQTYVLCILLVSSILQNHYTLCLQHNLQPPVTQEKLLSPQLRQQRRELCRGPSMQQAEQGVKTCEFYPQTCTKPRTISRVRSTITWHQ